jgi:DNA-binding transcriptional LysR family regulator
MRRADLADLTAFVAVGDSLSFRAAASHIGVTPSALSHMMRQLEERLGVRLLNRTTRSVALTDAGLRLLGRARRAVEQISRALDDLKSEQGHPFGRLRLYVSHFAVMAVIAPVWARVLSTFPDVQLEVHADETLVDIVAKGFDAGISSKDLAAADMIAVRVMGPMRVTVVGAPVYFARRRPPRTPDDLARHSCVQYRLVRRRRVRLGVRAGRQVTADIGGWPGHRQRSPSGNARGCRWVGNRVRHSIAYPNAFVNPLNDSKH